MKVYRGNGVSNPSLNLLILLALAEERLHGYAIGRWIRQSSSGALGVGEGQLYPALHRLAQRGWLKETLGETDTGRKAKFYELTLAGRQHLAEEQDNWRQYSDAMHQVIATRD